MADRPVPAPPDGYQEPYEYPEVTGLAEYVGTAAGRRFLGLQLLVVGGALLAVPADAPTARAVLAHYGGSELGRALLAVGGFYGLHFATASAHEHVHRAVERHFGYDAEIRYGFPASYTVVEEQMVERRHDLLSLALPLVALSSTAYLASAAAAGPTASVVFGAVFVLNTVYAAGDVRGALFLARRPRGTRAWTVLEAGTPRTYIYEPDPGADAPSTGTVRPRGALLDE